MKSRKPVKKVADMQNVVIRMSIHEGIYYKGYRRQNKL